MQFSYVLCSDFLKLMHNGRVTCKCNFADYVMDIHEILYWKGDYAKSYPDNLILICMAVM